MSRLDYTRDADGCTVRIIGIATPEEQKRAAATGWLVEQAVIQACPEALISVRPTRVSYELRVVVPEGDALRLGPIHSRRIHAATMAAVDAVQRARSVA